jgi:hypothetical protein
MAGLAIGIAAGFALGRDVGEPQPLGISSTEVGKPATTPSETRQPATASPVPTEAATTAPAPAQPNVAVAPTRVTETQRAAQAPPPPVAPVPTPAPPAPVVSSGQPACVKNCGSPRLFCDSGGWAFCDDYRDLYCPSQNFLNDCKFPDMDGIGRHVSVVTYSSTDPWYYPRVNGVNTPHGWFFNDQEHFHSHIEDGNFGVALMRHHQPIDLNGERRIHFEVDLKTSARRYIRLMLAPDVTKSMVDDRDGTHEFRPPRALDIWFHNGTIVGSVYPSAPDGGAFYIQSPRFSGVDNVRDLVDVYVSQSRVRVVINGTTFADSTIPALGFDRAYVYLAQASYNPCKDGECAENLQTFHWDNFAFDGPWLPDNSLVPAGSQDVVFLAYGQTSCEVKGFNAVPAATGDALEYTWTSWVARMPLQAVSTADVACVDGASGHLWTSHTNRTPFDFEVVAP